MGDWLQWQLPRLYGGDVNRFSDQLASSLQSFFTGGLVGLLGAAMDPGTYGLSVREDNKPGSRTLEQRYLERILQDETADHGAAKEQEKQTLKDLSQINTADAIEYSDRYGNIRHRLIQGGLLPNTPAADSHAALYYDSVRKMNTDVMHIAHNTGFSQQDIEDIKNYVFYELHDLGDASPKRFDPSFEMAQSWQRLMEGKNIQPHDITLLRHEMLERRLVKEGYSQYEAHIWASKEYDYSKEIKEYYGTIEKHKQR